MDEDRVDDVTLQIRRQIHKCFQIYGIEGTLQTIESVYKTCPIIHDLFMEEYRNALKGIK